MKPQDTQYKPETAAPIPLHQITRIKIPQSLIGTLIGSGICACLLISMLTHEFPVIFRHTNADPYIIFNNIIFKEV